MIKDQSLKLHKDNKGKISMNSKVKIRNKKDLSLAYSPGVAFPCLEISNNPKSFKEYTSVNNTVAVISDGSAVLGLGNIGSKASLPVMEGKCCLFKEFADIDSFPIIIDTQDTEEIISTIKNIASSFGGINLEDISSPRCVEIENRLKEELDIPVFHDDQHGTSIVTLSGLINSCRLLKKEIKDISVVVCGIGAAGSNIIRLLNLYGIKNIYAYDINGPIKKSEYKQYNNVIKSLIDENLIIDTNVNNLEELVKDKDCFIGVSAKNILTKEMVSSMNNDSIIFAMANPDPEIIPELAKEAGCKIIGTGRSDYPNQINNVLAFPGIFRGALDSNAKKITDEMKLAAAEAIANIIKEDELRDDYIVPDVFDDRVVKHVSNVIKKIVSK